MKSADVFAVVVRTVGLLVCLWSGAILSWAFINLLFGGPSSFFGLAVIGGPSLCVGLWLLRGAPSLIAFAYPNQGKPGQDRSEEWLA